MNFKRLIKLFSLLIALVFLACQQQYSTSSYAGGNLNIDNNIEPDSIMSNKIVPFKLKLDKQMNKVIGYANKDLNVSKPESDLSNLLADILQLKAKEFIHEKQADSLSLFTLINVKGIRVPIQKGDITVRNIFEVMPFENELVILSLPGDTIIKLFQFLAQTDGDGLSGARLVISNKSPQKIEIGDLKIDRSLNYYLATSDYLANGGDHYSMIRSPMNRINTGIKVREAMIEYIEKQTDNGENIDSRMDGRITYFKK